MSEATGNTMQNMRAATTNQKIHSSELIEPPPLQLTPVSGIGFNPGIRDMLFYVNKNEVIYAIGKHVVLQNIHSQKLSFFETFTHLKQNSGESQRVGDLCAMTVTPKRDYLAVARCPHPTAAKTESSISIYFIKTKLNTEEEERDPHRNRLDPVRILTYQVHSFSTLAFSYDGKFILGQTTSSDWTFVLWDWSRARKIATADAHTKVTRICFNPVDMAQMSTSGGVHLRLWRLSEPTCRPFATFNSANSAVRYVDHTWVGKSDGMVAILDNGDIQYFSNGELVRTIPSLHHGTTLHCVQAFKTSVVVGGDRGWISVLEIDTFQIADMHMTRRMRIDSKEAVLAISMDSSGIGFMCVMTSHYAAYDLSNLCLLREDDELVTLLTFSPLPRISAITSLSTSSRKQLVALTGKRPNGSQVACFYGQRETNGILHHTFVHVVPNAMDIHPSGFEVILSFSAQLHIYHVLHDSLKLAFEVDIKHASTVLYSPGGNYFLALVDDKAIYVYRSYGSLEPTLIAVCAGREANVTCLSWGPDDLRFYAADDFGYFVEWGVDGSGSFNNTDSTSTGTYGILDRPLVYSSIATGRNSTLGKSMIGASYVTDADTSTIHIWCDGRIASPPVSCQDIDAIITTLAFGPSCILCAGTKNGSVFIFSWTKQQSALGVHTLNSIPLAYDLSTTSITSLKCCLNEQTLIIGALDGTLISATLNIQIPPSNFDTTSTTPVNVNLLKATADTQFAIALAIDELSLVDRASVAEKILRITDLETEKEQIKMEKEIQLKLNAEQISLLERDRENEIRLIKSALEMKIKATEDDLHAKVQDAHATVLALKKDHEKNLQTMQSIFTTKLSTMSDVCRELEHQVIVERHRVEDATFGGEEKSTAMRQSMADAHAKEVQSLRGNIQDLEAKMEYKSKQYDELLSQLDDDHLIHLSKMQATVDRAHSEQASQLDSSKETISSLQQQLRMMLNALSTKDERVKQCTSEIAKLQGTVDSLQNELTIERKKAAKAASDCAALEAQVADQIRKIDGLNELNNVRLCKIKTMKQSIAEKEQQVHDMRVFVEELHAENTAVVEDANAMDDTQIEMKRKLNFYERSIKNQKNQMIDLKAMINAFRRDLGILIEDEQQGNRLKIDSIVKLYHKYDMDHSKGGTIQREMASDEAIIKELTRQNQCVQDHRRKLRGRLDAMTQERQKLVSVFSTDNTKLLRELNTLTKRNHELQQQIISLEINQQQKLINPSMSAPQLTQENNQILSSDVPTNRIDESTVYIPCTLNLPENAWKSSKNIPISQQRPRSGKPKLVHEIKNISKKQRPQSAHATKME